MDTPLDDTRPGYVVIRLDSAKADTLVWHALSSATLGATLLTPPPPEIPEMPDSATEHLLRRMTHAKRMLFIYSNSGMPDSVTFAIDSLAPQLAKMDAVCGTADHTRHN